MKEEDRVLVLGCVRVCRCLCRKIEACSVACGTRCGKICQDGYGFVRMDTKGRERTIT